MRNIITRITFIVLLLIICLQVTAIGETTDYNSNPVLALFVGWTVLKLVVILLICFILILILYFVIKSAVKNAIYKVIGAKHTYKYVDAVVEDATDMQANKIEEAIKTGFISALQQAGLTRMPSAHPYQNPIESLDQHSRLKDSHRDDQV